MVLATLLFGAVHLPQAAAIGGRPARLLGGVRVVDQRPRRGDLRLAVLEAGLVAAVSAQFAADIVLHVIAPAISSI
jgi:hypothetical protein